MTTRKTPAALALLIAAAAAQAQSEATPPPTTAQAPAAVESDDAALSARRVVRDPVTGKLRAANEDEVREMNSALQRRGVAVRDATAAPTPVQVRRHANGARSAVLGLDYMVTLRAERLPDGRLAVKHNQPSLDKPAVALQPTE